MPISYTIDPEKQVIFVTWTGDITAADIDRHWKRMLSDPEVLGLRRTLTEIGAAKFHFTGSELHDLIQTHLTPKAAVGGWKTAIVATDPLHRGLARQFQTFAEDFSSDMIFADAAKALAWLTAPDEPPLSGPPPEQPKALNQR